MGLAGITGVLSRYFVLGYFVPAFFTLFAVSQLATKEFLPAEFVQLEPASEVLVLGGGALLVGLVLLGLRRPVNRAFSGYPLEGRVASTLRIRALLVRLQKWSRTRSERTGAWNLRRRFPPEKRLLPTRYGNAWRAFERWPLDQFGLNGVASWPVVEPLLNEHERELHAHASSDVDFFRNGALGTLAVGVALLLDGIVNNPLKLAGWEWSLYAIPLPLAYFLYRAAIGAAERVGTERKASFVLHRHELYERVGLRRPTSIADEKLIAAALSAWLIDGTEIPSHYIAPEAPKANGGDA